MFFIVSCSGEGNDKKYTTSDGVVYWYTGDYKPLHYDAWAYSNYIDTPDLIAADRNNTYLKGIYFSGPDYRGHDTRFFAWLGVPPSGVRKKYPAMVLVHGGGTAFESWVRLWNARGYAAIAMDNTGGRPVGAYPSWQRDEYSTPANNAAGMYSPELPDNEQWQYFAVESIKRSISVLSDFTQVDTENIGITGVSWGGYLICAVSDTETRLKFGIPVYGCGNLYAGSLWQPDLETMDEQKRDLWISKWDPSRNLVNAVFPIHWVVGIHDPAYFMSAVNRSYNNLPEGKASASFYKSLPHGHGGPGEKPGEIFTVADSYVKSGKGLPRIVKIDVLPGKVFLEYRYDGRISGAVLFCTGSGVLTPETQWSESSLVFGSSSIEADILSGTKYLFINLYNENGLISSSRLIEVVSL